MTLAKTECIVSTNDETTIICTLVTPWVAGNWMPEVRDDKGLIPLSGSVSNYNVPLVISGVSPSSDLNLAGGDILTVTGENWPSTLEGFNL